MNRCKKEFWFWESHMITWDYKETLKFIWCSPFIAQIKVLEFLWDLCKIFILVKMLRYDRRSPALFPILPYYLRSTSLESFIFILVIPFSWSRHSTGVWRSELPDMGQHTELGRDFFLLTVLESLRPSWSHSPSICPDFLYHASSRRAGEEIGQG